MPHVDAPDLLEAMLASPEAADPDTETVAVSWDFLRQLHSSIVSLREDADNGWAQFHAVNDAGDR